MSNPPNAPDMLRATKCQLHGNACSSVSQTYWDVRAMGRMSSLFTATYRDCPCELKFRMMLSGFGSITSKCYNIGSVRESADAAMVANALLFQYLHDFHANKDVNPTNVALATVDAIVAANDAIAAATPGDSDDASYVNVAKLAADSARAARLLLFRSWGYTAHVDL